MNKLLVLSKRNLKEMTRDPVSLIFCVGLPIFMLVLMELIFSNMGGAEGVTMFEINNYAPAIAVFGFTFTMLYVALMIAGDKGGAFMTRILVSPVGPLTYLFSYVVACIPVVLCQTVLVYLISLIFNLQISWGLLVSMVYLIPSALFFVSCGLLIGAIAKNAQQTGPFCSLLITASGLLGGIWMPLESIGGTFFTVCECLPFYNCVKLGQVAIAGNYGGIFPCILWVLGYTVVFTLIAVLIFKKTSKK